MVAARHPHWDHDIHRAANRVTRRASTRFGQALHDLRTRREVSQEALGLKAGVCRTAVSRYETGRRGPSAYTVTRLADALGLRGTDRATLFRAAGMVADDPDFGELPPLVERLAAVMDRGSVADILFVERAVGAVLDAVERGRAPGS